MTPNEKTNKQTKPLQMFYITSYLIKLGLKYLLIFIIENNIPSSATFLDFPKCTMGHIMADHDASWDF